MRKLLSQHFVRSNYALKLLLFALTALASSSLVHAQDPPMDTDNTHNIGLPPNGVFDGDSLVSVQLNNGNVHIELPIWSAPGRGKLAVGYKYVYNSKAWSWRPPSGQTPGVVLRDVGALLTLVDPGAYRVFSKTHVTYQCEPQTPPETWNHGTYTVWSDWVLQEPDGTKHALIGEESSLGPTTPPCYGNTNPKKIVLYAEDGTG